MEHTTEVEMHVARLVEMTQDECWELLASQPVGRLAWKSADGINVVPLNYRIDDHEVVLRTTPYSTLARECCGQDVAFEVDQLDVEHHSGWSVVVRGQCRREERASDGLTPWATGRRVLGLRVEARSVTGRRLLPS